MKNLIDKAKRYAANRTTQQVVLIGLLMAFGMHDVLAVDPTTGTPPTGGGALPWEDPLKKVMCSLSGPVAKAAAVIAFVVTGLLVAFGEAKGMFGTMLRIAFGLSLALMAVQWIGHFGVTDVSCTAP